MLLVGALGVEDLRKGPAALALAAVQTAFALARAGGARTLLNPAPASLIQSARACGLRLSETVVKPRTSANRTVSSRSNGFIE